MLKKGNYLRIINFKNKDLVELIRLIKKIFSLSLKKIL